MRRVFIYGKHVCYQGGDQGRDSDTTMRLSAARAAAELLEPARGEGRGERSNACVRVAEVLMNSSCDRLRSRFLQLRRGRRSTEEGPRKAHTEFAKTSAPSAADRDERFVELDDRIAADRHKAASVVPMSDLERLATIVRSQVDRYRRQHPDWPQEFESQVGLFRYAFLRDPEWYDGVESSREAWLTSFEMRTQPFEWWEAMPLAHLARLYHEQGKYELALDRYRKAIGFARRAKMADELRTFLLQHFRTSAKLCARRLGPLDYPTYKGPWVASDTVR